MNIRIGIIGTGAMGAAHARTLAEDVGGATVSVVTDIDLQRADQVAAGVGARVAADAAALIGSDDVDAVLIASHDTTHADLVLACIEAGKPVLCEKPLALTVADCLRVVEAERRTGARWVSVGFSRRFDPAIADLRDRVRAGAVGTPLLIHAAHRNVATYPGGDSAASVHSTAIHELDQIPWVLASPVVEVSWYAPRATSLLAERQDPQLILLRTADGVLSTLEIFVNAVYGYDIRFEVVGERGAVSLAPQTGVVSDDALTRAERIDADFTERFAEAYRRELKSWVHAVATGDYAGELASADDGMRASVVAHAVVAALGHPGRPRPVAYPAPNEQGHA